MKNKWLFYATAFFSGLSVMAIELGAQRLMAPYFSSSQIVWTIIIGTIMIAMAIGNVLGGRIADKYNNPDHLFGWLFGAATWTMLIPLVGKFIIAGVALVLAMFVTTNYLIVAAFVSCILVFVFPLLVLGMVTPNLVKYATSSLEESGRTAGRIEACGTIGSIIGTFLPTFVTIPNIGTAMTFVLFASILYIVCIVYAILRKKRFIGKGVVVAVALVLGILSNNIGVAFWETDILYEGESIYNYLRVEEDEDSIYLSTNVLFGVQSVKMKTTGLTGMYYDYALAAPVMAGAAENEDVSVLILGLGTGTFATQCEYYFGITDIDGVEIDQKIIDLAYEYFDLSDCVTTYTQDGRAYINLTDNTYDVIMVDAYQDITIPFQMSSVEFFEEVAEQLNDGGVMVVNMNMYSTGDDDSINDYLCGTIKSVFDSVYTVTTSGSNLVLFASNSYDCQEQLEGSLDSLDSTVKTFMTRVGNRMTEVEESNLILTDDKAPVELLGMKVLDEMISSELESLKNMMQNMSIGELYQYLVG
ncbi:MAG: fused MFS/spermidine synthase [Oscillospiraceae bacterium]|nr:fused MFS/spermidine synthase [Oscillospiraceae bacterium]